MMARSLLLAALASLLASTPATAERRRASRDDDSRRSLGKTERADRDDRKDRRSRDADEDVDSRDGDDGDRPRRKKDTARKARVADLEELEDEGPEAQAVLPVTLDELIEVSVRLSPELARSKVDRTIAKGAAGASRKEQSWLLGAEASYAINAVSREVVDVPPFSTVREDQAKASLTLGRKLPTGGTFGVEVGMTRVGKEIAIPQEYLDAINAGQPQEPMAGQQEPTDEYFTTHQAIAKLTFTQPLARGLGPDVALAAERRADLEFTAATLQTQLAAEELVFNIVSGYWELAYLAEAVDQRNEGVKAAELQESKTREAIKAGAAAPSEINAVSLELATRREALLVAQLDFEKKSLELRRRAGLELSRRRIAIRPSDPFRIGAEDWDVEEVLTMSRKANRRLLQLGVQRKLAEVDTKVAKNGMLPQIDLNLSGGLIGNGSSQDQAFSGIGAANGYEVMAGLKIQFEVSGAARAAHEAATAKKARVEIDRADAARTLDTEVVAATKQVMAARVRADLTEKAISVAEQSVKAETLNWRDGKTDNFSLMQRQNQLIDSHIRRARAIADYHLAVAQLQHLSGVILTQYRVNARPAR